QKLGYEQGRVFLSMTPLVRRYVLIGDIVRIGYANLLLPARIVGKSDHLVADIFYTGEGKLADRSKPRVPVQKEFGFTVLLKVEGVYRTFDPVDISEVGISVTSSDPHLVPLLMGKSTSFKITGREELSGVTGTAQMVSVMEEGLEIRLAFELELEDAYTTKIRLYVVNAIKRILGS
ncbi:MAG: hypothetical protein N3C13_00320, partial [Aquificaceae bacterium]|nr:hypothetical protein [Aquificaceae bacterium]